MSTQDILLKAKNDGIKVSGISFDTRTLKKNNIFFAIPGSNDDGLRYVDLAINRGASAIVVSFTSKKFLKKRVPVYRVRNIRSCLSNISFRFYKNDIKNKIAVTGTNGKTSVSFFTNYLLSSFKKKSATIGTLGTSTSVKLTGNLTTPDPISMAKEMQIMHSKNIDYVIIEASSHGLHQKRFSPLKFNLCLLTNISHDHLDYHKNINHYITSKLDLFKFHLKKNGKSLVNSDTNHFKRIKDSLQKNKINFKILSNGSKRYGIKKINIKDDLTDVEIFINSKLYKFNFKDLPIFQIKNFLLAVTGLSLIGFNEKKMTKFSLNCPHVPGRMELAGKKNNGARVYIDFAHTPDALKNVLSEAKIICKGQLVVLFGCGGNRDKKKRPLMGRIAEKYSDIALVTDDNPRDEDANKIRKEIVKNSKKLINLKNRKNAIKKSISLLKSKDILIIAGKGHEKYQIIKGKRFPFDDVKIAKSFLRK
tara:strand:- start:6345 stop:7775 length:1431 start_codon:yes stop_codon:yes gene_type:complete